MNRFYARIRKNVLTGDVVVTFWDRDWPSATPIHRVDLYAGEYDEDDLAEGVRNDLRLLVESGNLFEHTTIDLTEKNDD